MEVDIPSLGIFLAIHQANVEIAAIRNNGY
jgi:hypothetical protein